jgi:hypothetical protein
LKKKTENEQKSLKKVLAPKK